MRWQSITGVVFLESTRAPGFRVLAFAGTLLAGLPLVFPVRFRDPLDFGLELAPAALSLYGLMVAAFLGVPAARPENDLFASRRIGLKPVSPDRFAAAQFLGLSGALLLGGLVAVLGQSVVLVAVHGDAAPAGGWPAFVVRLLGADAVGLLQGLGILAFARLLGAWLPGAAALLALFAGVSATHFLAASIEAGSALGWILETVTLPLPGLDLLDASMGAFVTPAHLARLGALVALHALFCNLLVSWSLDAPGRLPSALDRPGPGS